MRQAGRSLSAYQKLKKSYSFKTLLKTPELACRVTEMPLKSLGVDCAILFSDILVVLEALGMSIDYDAPIKKKPFIETPLNLGQKLDLKKIDITKLNHNYETIKLYKRKNSLPLIGFCASPLTAFLYLYHKKDQQFLEALTNFYAYPKVTDDILNTIYEVSLEYAEKQIASGIDAFQIFDTWANIIPFDDYKKRIEPFIIKMANKLSKKIPVIFFPRFFSHGYEFLESKLLKNIQGLSIDTLTSLKRLKKISSHITLQGNFSPLVLRSLQGKKLVDYIKNYLEENKNLSSWIFNLGHGVLPDTPERNLKLLVKTLKENYPS